MFKTTFAVAMVGAASLAHADADLYESQGFQFGVAVGRSDAKVTSNTLVGSASGNDFGYKLFAGYRLNQYVAFEGTWEHSNAFEDFDDGGTADTVSTDDDSSLRLKPRIYGASVLGSLPFAEVFAFNARVGVSHWETDVRFTDGPDVLALNDKGDDLKWGIGLSGHLDGALIRLEYEQMDVSSDKIPGVPLDFRFRQLTVGAVWLF